MDPATQSTSRNPTALGDRRHDVLIIGGGINGAGLARDLALRGVDVVLVDKGDFGSGTSSASTKLIHGGVRYLERLQLGLVFEACRERRVLQTIAPHLVHPLPFLIPVYRGDPRSLLTIRAGLTLYDALALFRNTHPHSTLSPEQGRTREPALRVDGLKGVARYWDCRTDDARLCRVVAAGPRGGQFLRTRVRPHPGGRVAAPNLPGPRPGAGSPRARGGRRASGSPAGPVDRSRGLADRLPKPLRQPVKG